MTDQTLRRQIYSDQVQKMICSCFHRFVLAKTVLGRRNPILRKFLVQSSNFLIPNMESENQEDNCELLSNSKHFLTMNTVTQSRQTNVTSTETAGPSFQANSDAIATDIANSVSLGTTDTLPVAYVSGFIAKKIFGSVNCSVCGEQLLSTSHAPHNLFISYKEWSEDKENLQYPSENLVSSVAQGVQLLEQILGDSFDKPQVGVFAHQLLQETIPMTWLTCPSHKQLVADAIIRGIWRVGIPWWCKRDNTESKQKRKDSRPAQQKVKKLRRQ